MLSDFNLTQKQSRSIGWSMNSWQLHEFMQKTGAKQYEVNAIRFSALESTQDLCRMLGVSMPDLQELINQPQYREFAIPKKGGGQRHISAPHESLKQVQQRLNFYLQALYLVRRPECSHGFISRPNSSQQEFNIVSNARPHTGKKFVMNIDLADFFPSISANRVKQLFAGSQFGFTGELPIVLALLCTFKRSLPIGSPVSPVIANFISMELDLELMQACKEKGINYTRYADDLTFSSELYFDQERIQAIRNVIVKHGFRINENKFRVQSKQGKQTVTGLLVNKKPNVDRRYIRKLRAILNHWKNEGMESAAKKHLGLKQITSIDELTDFSLRIQGCIGFVGMVRGKADIVYRKLKTTFDEFGSPPPDTNQLPIWKRPY